MTLISCNIDSFFAYFNTICSEICFAKVSISRRDEIRQRATHRKDQGVALEDQRPDPGRVGQHPGPGVLIRVVIRVRQSD